ncbi:AbiU2 domain-containing protein [Rubinisphaera margarita]|uniref:AbiU2 domain-containing protein n=1 Tax=Rubinisphaera margarita TaxID=2909586 RepID=UPI001EE8F001|nr:hypothetical protein [Rubinisphaera margarita]MCG6154215.1 hypothetical protein [Rubinisphaera margarita]
MEQSHPPALDYSQIPEPLREIFETIENELTWLHGRWIMYRQLFGADQQTLDLLNQSAPTFFGMLQFLWLDYVVLEICSLTDRPRSFGRDNLVLRQLYEKLDREAYAKLVEQLEQKGELVEQCCGKLRTIRNRRIAHRDQRAALGAYQTPILGVSRKDVDDALVAMRDYVNCFRMEFLGSEMAFDQFELPDDATTLLSHLEAAVQNRKTQTDAD